MRYADSFCTYTEAMNPHRYIFTGPCRVTKVQYSVEIPSEELYAYRQGAMIQDAMKSVSKDNREFLMSGYSPAGWFKQFGEEQQFMLILQGVPGSGKSVFARKVMTKTINAVIVSTDEWRFDLQGNYVHDPAKNRMQHQAAQQKARVLLSLGCSVIVDNTNITNAHIKPYVQMATEMGVEVNFMRITGDFDNIHDVPPETIKRMLENMEELSVEKALAS